MPGLDHYFKPQKRKLENTDPPTQQIEKSSPKDGKAENLSIKNSILWQYLTDPSWQEALSNEFDKPYFRDIESTISKAWQSHTIVFPPKHQIFSALNFSPIKDIRVVLIGQDPYHNHRQANGLCFSVYPGVDTPPSLKNMFKELTNDVEGFRIPSHGCLIPWAKQGVLLLNASLTVEAHKANSHSQIGWQRFTDACISHLNKHRSSLVFLLLGNFAQKKCQNIDTSRHHVIRCAHPSPLSVTRFRGSRIFSKCNAYLRETGQQEITWTLPLQPEESWKS